MTATKTKSHRHWRFRMNRQLKWLMTILDENFELDDFFKNDTKYRNSLNAKTISLYRAEQ